MKLGNPYFLGLLWIVPGLILFYVWAFKKRKALVDQFVSPDLKERLLTGVSYARQRLKAFLMVAGTLFTIFACLQPKWGFHWEEVTRRGVDIIVALDVSKSMLAEDVSPNRLERAKRKIIDFLRIVQGDRIGLIAFAGTSYLQCPLTLDHGAVQIFLDSVDTELIPVPGTAIGGAIELSIKSFENSSKSSRALILITDGEDTVGNPIEAAKRANEQGIKIYTIGIGKEGGTPIPNQKGGGFKKDRKGEVIMTHLDEPSLQKVALETGGSYVRSVSGDLDLEKIYEDLRKNTEEKELKSGRQKRFEERFQWPLFLAFLCFLLEVVLSERKANHLTLLKRVRFPRFRVSVLVFFMSSLVPIGSFGSSQGRGERFYQQQKYGEALKELLDAQIENPQSLMLKYNTANAYYKMNQYPEAERLFQAVAVMGEKQLSQKAYYNLGNTNYRQGKLNESLASYQKATELDPKDEDAKHNLEFVRREIRRRMEENKNRPQQSQTKPKPPGKEDSKKESSDPKKDPQQGDKSEENNQGAQGKAEEKKGEGAMKEMSEEEAKQWLSTLKEGDRSKFKTKEGKNGGDRTYEVEKDW